MRYYGFYVSGELLAVFADGGPKPKALDIPADGGVDLVIEEMSKDQYEDCYKKIHYDFDWGD